MLKILYTATSPLLLILSSSKSAWLFTPPILMSVTLIPIMYLYSQMTPYKALFSFTIDPTNSPLIILSIWITALMFLSSMKILNQKLAPSQFSFWSLLLLFFLLMSFSTNNMLMFYVMFESTLIPITILILSWGYQPERLQASFYLFLYTILASLPLLISILIISTTNHSFLLMSKWVISHSPENIMSMWWLFMNMAFMVKLPLFLTHLWLPKAHVEAPIAGSMILAAILLKLGSYGLLRMTLHFPPSSSLIPSLIISIALWGAINTSLMCLRQTDLKALIAYSSVGHMGLLIAGALTISYMGYCGASFMMIAHGLSSSALFSIANMTYETTNTRSVYISKGLAMVFPYMALWWFLLSAANMAAPPSINLFSEILLIISVMSYFPIAWLPLMLISFLSAAYSLYLYTTSQHGQTPNFMNPMSIPSTNNYTTIFLHLTPIILLMTKPELLLL